MQKHKVNLILQVRNKMKNKILANIIALVIIISPMVSFSAGIIPDCNRGTSVNADQTGLGNACDFNYFMLLINNIITFLLFTIATPLVALIVCYVGFLFLTGGGNPENRSKAKRILQNVIFGYAIGLAAWLIVKTILNLVGFDPKEAYLEY